MFENLKARIKLKQFARNYRTNKDLSELLEDIFKNYDIVTTSPIMKYFQMYTFENSKNKNTKLELTFWNSNKYYAWMNTGNITLLKDGEKKNLLSWTDEMPEAKTMLKIKELNKKIIKETVLSTNG